MASNLRRSLPRNPFCGRLSNGFLPSQSAHRAWKGFAMGATTKSITGLFANVCGRNVCGRNLREQIAAGHGTRSAATQGYLPLSLSGLRRASRHERPSCLDQFSWLHQARDQARWLLKRLGGHLSSALPNISGMLASTSGVFSPAWCPASSKPQAMGPRLQAAGRRTVAR
jgi:hypothetical protein